MARRELLMYSWLQEALADSAQIVTATDRLARELRAAHDRHMQSAGRRAWRTPSILSWTAWLRALVRHAPLSAPAPFLLESPASAFLWERLLREEAGQRLLAAPGLVRQMRDTWQRLRDWCIPTTELAASAGSDDQRLFASVAAAYERELAANGWMDTAQLAGRAGTLLRERHLEAPRLLVQAGFDRLPPAMSSLLGILAERGCGLRVAPVAERRQSLRLVAAADADAELRAAGQWARQQLAGNPSARVAVVRASLETGAARSARILRDSFAPGWQYGERGRFEALNVSYGRRLSEYPMIDVALLWLKWARAGLESREVGVLLRSPFTGPVLPDECHRLDTRLRRLPDRHWSPESLADALPADPANAGSAGWIARLREVAQLAQDAPNAAPPADCAERIATFLQRVGWPGNRPLDSAEFQLLNRWRELLNELGLLEPVHRRLRLGDACARLAGLAAETLFQPESGDGLLQLLGPLEAAGLEFDSVWFANLEATQWPVAARPMPLVSRGLQRSAGMPDAVPGDTLEHARRILGRVTGSARSVVLSWPLTDGDAELVPSPLLDAWRERPAGTAEDPGWFARELCGGDEVCEVRDDPVPPVRAGERIYGGASTVQRQFDEPFAAFARGRLGCRSMPAIEVGVSASLRGNITHHALRILLDERPSRAEMQGWSAGERDRRAARAVDAALLVPARHADAVLQGLLALERTRLKALLQRFLDGELARPAFKVERVEAALDLLRHGIALGLRVDRIDRLDDDSLLVIDYKTGAPRTLLNAAGEPAEWQTVVYAAALDERIGGLALINVDSRGISYRGTGDNVPWNRLSHDDWAARLEAWSRAVDDAIAGIATGDARVDVARSAELSRPLNVLSRAEVLKRVG